MRIAAVMQYYFDAQLPRDPSWASWGGLKLQAPAFSAEISPWEPSTQPLFPHEIDNSLAGTSLSIVPLGMHGGAITRTIADTVVDRIQVVLRWEEDLAPGDTPHIDLDLAQDRGVGAANVLVEHLRSAGRAAWMPRVRRAWRPEDGRFHLLSPWTATVFDADTGTGLPVFAGVNAQLSSGAVRSPGTGAIPVSGLEASLQGGTEPPLHNVLLVDAETAVQSLALREAILSMASACETAAHTYIATRVGDRAKRYEQGLTSAGGSFAVKYYERAPTDLSSRSLRSDDPSAFSAIEEMYRERNALMHSGRTTARLAELDSRERQRTVYAFLGAAGRTVDWISAL
ncbi:hypothetical protein GA0115240_139221 [Streptomyces sp. DvalAA-14]|uniref:hypothetical protein n=1 Tax=unclassified Streptomyces TaxID=2593676 RepID=UPI00081B52E8|nr:MULTISPECIES: hypothetical protein [unclassified Streptomyces]MYS22239.1 hypothetical protein [Streptomyces sp. SID4948]SCE11860.1 hypothetical protein GA0115240_139221 [Streptomyces sp. DvalAA-14]